MKASEVDFSIDASTSAPNAVLQRRTSSRSSVGSMPEASWLCVPPHRCSTKVPTADPARRSDMYPTTNIVTEPVVMANGDVLTDAGFERMAEEVEVHSPTDADIERLRRTGRRSERQALGGHSMPSGGLPVAEQAVEPVDGLTG